MPLTPDYMELAAVHAPRPGYILHLIRDRVLGRGGFFEDGADAVEAAMEFATSNKQGLALLQHAEFPKAHWTMFKWSEAHDNVVPLSVMVTLGTGKETA
jgi:hypothetical protein